jgi:hypothetical protein
MSKESVGFKPTKTLLGFCGLDCGECKVFIATQNNSMEMKRAVAEEWSKLSGRVLKAEDMNCVGCIVADGVHYGACALCEIRLCGVQKKVETCAFCSEYNCGKLKRIHAYSPKAKERLSKQKQTMKK